MIDKTEKLFDKKFIRVFDLQYAEGKHYFDATRRDENELVCKMTDDEFNSMIPDAVGCVLIVKNEGEEPKLVVNRELRYPLGRYILSIPAGLIDDEDKVYPAEEAIKRTALREMKEETGLEFREGDEFEIISPCLFSSPGMTDESNAMVRIVLKNCDLSALSSKGCVGTEDICGYAVLTRAEAQKVLKNGPIAIHLWVAITEFINHS